MNKVLRILLMASFTYFLASFFSACVQNKEDKTSNGDSIPVSGEAPDSTKKNGVVLQDTTIRKEVSRPSIPSDTIAFNKAPLKAKPALSKKKVRAKSSQKENMPLDTAFINKQKALQAEALERAHQQSIERAEARKLAKEKALAAEAERKNKAAAEKAKKEALQKEKLAASAQLKAEALEKAKSLVAEKQLRKKNEKAYKDSLARENMAAKAANAEQAKKDAEENRIATINQAKQKAADRIQKLTEAKMKSDSLARAGVSASPRLKGKAPVTVKKGLDVQAMIDADAKQKIEGDKHAETKPDAGLREEPKTDTLRDNLQTAKKEEVPVVKKKKEPLAPLNYPTDKKYESLIDQQIYYASEIRKDHLPEKLKTEDKAKLQKVTASIDSMKMALNPTMAPERKPELLKMDDRAELASMMPPTVYAHEIGSLVYGLGVSYLGPNYSFPLVLSADKAWNAKFSLGGYLGYFRENILEQGPPKNNSVYTFNSVNYSYGYYCFGARGTYHLLNPESFLKLPGLDRMEYDFYTTASIGYNLASSPLAAIQSDTYSAPQKSGLNYGLSLGLRYMLDDKLGVFAEAGYSRMGFVTLGISYSYRKVNRKSIPIPAESKPEKTNSKTKQGVSKNKKK